MDLIAGLKSEVFRPVSTIIVPGVVAVVPFVFVAEAYNPSWVTFGDKYPEIFTVIALVVVIAAGFLLECLGAWIEVFWDGFLEKKYPGHGAQWRSYLTLKLKDEIIGQRYLDKVVTNLKFELSFAPALICLMLGLNWLNQVDGLWSRNAMFWVSCGILVLTAYVLYESYTSACLASKTRREILSGFHRQAKN